MAVKRVKENLKSKVFKVLSKNKAYVLANKNIYIYRNWMAYNFSSENKDTVLRHISEYKSRLREDFIEDKTNQTDLMTPELTVDDALKYFYARLTLRELGALGYNISKRIGWRNIKTLK